MTQRGFRYVNESVGVLVLLAVLLLVGTILQAGVLRHWFNPPLSLRVLLPPDGVAGLSAGSEVVVLGTRAGQVRRIVIEPDMQMHAEVDLDPGMDSFVRRDSTAVIRKQFGVAGAAFLDIGRGTGRPLDWGFAVIPATTERAPQESIGQIIEELRTRILPIIEDTARAIRAAAGIVERINDPQGDLQAMVRDVRALTERIEKGEGAVGRLLTDDTLVRELETTVREANERLKQARGVITELERTTAEAAALTRGVRQRSETTMRNVESVTADLAKATPQLPAIARNLEASTATLPQVLVQTQQTALEMERLLNQLRSHWLFGGLAGGGGNGRDNRDGRQPAREVRP
jgi:phospholipid/cholesterol/gamma-HCH transport system substrate-binding protein